MQPQGSKMRYQARITMISRSWSMNVKPVPHVNSNLFPRVFVSSREAKDHGNNVARRAVNTQFSFYDLSIRVEAITLPKFQALVLRQSEWGKRPRVSLPLRHGTTFAKKLEAVSYNSQVPDWNAPFTTWQHKLLRHKSFRSSYPLLERKKSLKKGCTKCCWN